MINALISLDADLASSIALRYSCRLMELTDMRLQPIHVEEVDKEGYPPGSGWVRSTWERGLLQTAREEISQLINAEKSACRFPDTAIMRIGNREDELLKEVETLSYDLLLEGVLNSFDAQLFQKKVRSKLYRYAPCPILLVKNLVNPDHAALIMEEMKDVNPVVAAFRKLFDKSRISVDLACFIIRKSHEEPFRERLQEAEPHTQENAASVIEKAAALLAEGGWAVRDQWIVRDEAKKIGEMLGEYGLVCARIPYGAHKKNQTLDLLSRVPTATLLCRS